MAGPAVLVLGGGTGGVVAARSLRRRLGHRARVVLVERSPSYRFAPSFLWVMTGARRPDEVTADLGRLARRGVEVVRAEVHRVDPGRRVVETGEGSLTYDRLVVALGAELVPEALQGFPEAAHNLYTLEGAVAAGRALRGFPGGRLVVLVSRLPYKCPAAPYEAALLADAVLRRRGVRDRSVVDVYTPEPTPMPVAGPAVGEAVRSVLAARGIGLHPERVVERVDPGARELVLADGERVAFDLLLGVPPHRAPRAVAESGLAGETGFIPVDRATLEAAPGVFAIGDVTAVPVAGGKMLPKAGVFAEGQAGVVARRIADELGGREPTAAFHGHGSCFLEVGDGRAAFARGDFYAPEAPRVRLHPPGRHWHLAKVAFERYWLRRWL